MMKMTSQMKNTDAVRKNERGAALISTLLLSMLLLTAGGALVLTSSMSATNAIDSTAEMQAYYGAEAGLQSAMNVLRGNVWSDNATPAVNFRTAVEPSVSNKGTDPATGQNVARLSNWLSYSDAAAYPSRVVANGESGKQVIAYDVTARDIDDSKNVSYSTTGAFDAADSGCVALGASLTCGAGVNTFILTYTPKPATAVMAYPAVPNAGLGTFTLVKITNGNVKIEDATPAKFRLRINQTLPWAAYNVVTASISGEVKAASSTLAIKFLRPETKVDGTSFALCAACKPLTIAYAGVSGISTALTSTLTAPEPKRILVRSTGYGPKGAIKRLEMMLNQTAFDFEAPAVLTMRGADDGTTMTFDIGSSNAKNYSGLDHHDATSQLPTFAVLGGDLAAADTGIKKESTVADPKLGYLDISNVPAGSTVPAIPALTPEFLQTANNARKALNTLQTTADNMGRYYKPTSGSAYTVSSTNTTATGITFVDGDCNLDGGSGLLVVTGQLNMSGNPSFDGVILVLGAGRVNRNGGGNGNVYGAMVVASFSRNGGGFTAPSFNTNGGGNSTMQYDSLAVSRAMGAIGAVPGGIREF